MRVLGVSAAGLMLPCGHVRTDMDAIGCMACRSLELMRQAEAMGREVRKRCVQCNEAVRRARLTDDHEATPALWVTCGVHGGVP